MKKEQFRKFLPSVIPIDLTGINAFHVETCFITDNGNSYTKIEKNTDLSPGGISFANLSLHIPHKDYDAVFSARIPESDATYLLGTSVNKIKKYKYHLRHEHADVFINRYTLGIITIDIDSTLPIDTLPEYCGIEVTGDKQYEELYLSAMREIIRQDKKKKLDRDINL